MTGKSAITDAAGNFSVETITVAEPKEKEVLVQIKASGVCHIDFDSQFWGDQLVMGYEGAGGVGLNVIQAARISGASKIIAIDVREQKLELARQFGATHTILTDREDEGLLAVAKKVKSFTDNRGADYAFECTAIPELSATPLAMVRNAGTAVQVSGIEQKITVDMKLFAWDKVYINPIYGKCRPQIDLPNLMNLYAKGDLLLDELVTKTYKLTELDQAFSDCIFTPWCLW